MIHVWILTVTAAKRFQTDSQSLTEGSHWDWLCQGEAAEKGAKEDFKIRAVSTCINSLALKKLQ